MKQQSPMLRLWELGEGQQGGLKRAVLSAVVGVLFGMLPYFAVAQIILGLLSGNQESSFYLTWCAVALVGFLLRATLYSLALSQSHKATFAILKSIREKSAGELQDASGYDSGHLQRPDEAGHRRSGGEHGAASGPSSAGDDRQCAGTGVHLDLSVRAGLADGPFEPGVHPGGHGFHDGGDGRLRKAVRELGQTTQA